MPASPVLSRRALRAGVFAAALLALLPARAEVELDGRHASPESIARIARGETLRIAPAALARVRQSHQVLLDAARSGQKIYGLTVGVGLNKDRDMVDA
ncbi:MAG: aromatic amino acid lyase, partial [Janthinobacterium sp.]